MTKFNPFIKGIIISLVYIGLFCQSVALIDQYKAAVVEVCPAQFDPAKPQSRE